jgi:hypothetical protein
MKSRTFLRIFGSAVGLMLTAALAIQLTGVFSVGKLLAKQTQGYQAVLLDNNQVYYGKLTGLGSDYPTLTDVFYVQTAVNQETKQSSNVLLKRGKEWHAPDRMLLSARHIIMVEPVNAGSTVANLIDQASRK